MEYEIDVIITKGYLLDMLKVLESVVDDAVFVFTEAGLMCRCVDPAHVMMAQYSIDTEAFENYEVPKTSRFAITLEKLHNILKISDSECRIRYDGGHKIVFISGAITKKIGVLALDDIKPPKPPEITFSNSFNIKNDKLLVVVKGSDGISDNIKIGVSKTYVKFISAGDVDNVQFEYLKDGVIGELEFKEHTKANYSLEYFKKVVGCTGKNTIFKVDHGDLKPISFSFYDSERLAHAKIMIAPRED